MPIKVLLADDTAVLRRAIRNLLQEESAIKLVGEAKDFSQTLTLVDKLNPQVVILDLHMPCGSELSTLAAARGHLKSCGARIVAISVFSDEETEDLAESFGAHALLDKMRLGQELIPAVRNLASANVTDLGAKQRRFPVRWSSTP